MALDTMTAPAPTRDAPTSWSCTSNTSSVRIPNGLPFYSPLKYYGLDKPGLYLRVVRLSHMAVKFAKAMGMKVTVISTSPKKKDEALACTGADGWNH
ncbi:hypothetical protein V2J09_022831 [Rumex salicifolius]